MQPYSHNVVYKVYIVYVNLQYKFHKGFYELTVVVLISLNGCVMLSKHDRQLNLNEIFKFHVHLTLYLTNVTFSSN